MECARCGEHACYEGLDCTDITDRVREQLADEETLAILRTAGSIEADFYCRMTRLEEIMEFARRMGYRRLGLAFCIGLAEEAAKVDEILSAEFEVSSACCKLCGIEKLEMGMKRLVPERDVEATCNPVGQALALAEDETELNIVLGLCVGHDVLFHRFSKAPVTTLAAKDRVLAHNPIAAVTCRYVRKRFSSP